MSYVSRFQFLVRHGVSSMSHFLRSISVVTFVLTRVVCVTISVSGASRLECMVCLNFSVWCVMPGESGMSRFLGLVCLVCSISGVTFSVCVVSCVVCHVLSVWCVICRVFGVSRSHAPRAFVCATCKSRCGCIYMCVTYTYTCV